MRHSYPANERRKFFFLENIKNQTPILDEMNIFPVKSSNACSLFPPMLKSIQTQIGNLGCFRMIRYTNNAAHNTFQEKSGPYQALLIFW